MAVVNRSGIFRGTNEANPWFERGACKPVREKDGTDYWYPAVAGDEDFVGTGQFDEARLNKARRVCRDCPVKVECLKYALERKEKFGIWGGLTPDQRRKLERKLT